MLSNLHQQALERRGMKKSTTAQCARAVSLFRGLYARVAHDLGVDVSYVSRIARGERKSKIAEKALSREFARILASITKSLTPTKGKPRIRNGKRRRML